MTCAEQPIIARHATALLLALIVLTGCQAPQRNLAAVHSYYDYDFTRARAALRGDAELRNDGNVLLNNARLGMAAMADGDLTEAERALGRSFKLLSTAGLNRDRTTAAVVFHEGVRIWKGEPFEQALIYHETAALYAVMGDWENARAAAANSIFRLTDFGADQSPENLVQNAARDPNYLDRGYRAVDTNFTLGFLMQAVASDISSAGGASELYDAALQIDSEIQSLVNVLRSRDFDTLLIIDYGKGPTKLSYGPDNALVHFQPQERTRRPILVHANDELIADADPVCDVNEMAFDHRWNNLENIRSAKSAIGTLLVGGGAIVASSGGRHHRDEALLAGLGMIAAGLATKAGARADTRYLELAPQCIYLVPVRLEGPRTLRITGDGGDGTSLVLPDFQPGTTDQPRAVYLRLHGSDSPQPQWLTAAQPLYTNDHTEPGNLPWILGGCDVSTPSPAIVEAYHAAGCLEDCSLGELKELYRAEEIHLGSGMESRPDMPRNPSFRHILEGGTGLFTPALDSIGYKRLFFSSQPPYDPKSRRVREMYVEFETQTVNR